jgi:hypothetical protein
MPGIFGVRDLRAFCRPMGVPVSFGGVTTYPDGEEIRGLFDRPQQIKLMDEGIGGMEIALPELRLPYNAFNPMPQANAVITVDGTVYTVSPATAEDDGGFFCYQLHLTGGDE